MVYHIHHMLKNKTQNDEDPHYDDQDQNEFKQNYYKISSPPVSCFHKF